MTEQPPIKSLSFSALCDLKKSAFRFWRKRIDPNRPDQKKTKPMSFGNLAHVMTFEPQNMGSLVAVMPSKAHFPDAFDTVEQMKSRLNAIMVKIPSKANKPDLKWLLIKHDYKPVFWDDIMAVWNEQNADKVQVSADDVKRAEFLSSYVRSHPEAAKLIMREDGRREDMVEWTNIMGIPMRGKFDLIVFLPEDAALVMEDGKKLFGWILVELKTFANPYEKDLDRIVTDKFSNELQYMQLAIYEEGVEIVYGIKLDWFVTIFAETGDFPHVILRANKAGGMAMTQGVQLYYELCRKFLYYQDKHGYETPWVDQRQHLRLFQDEEFPIWIFN